jgi:hypothetical protein
LWSFVDYGVGDFTAVGSWEEVGEVCYFVFHVPECTYPFARFCRSRRVMSVA